jgi:hypothetical protein
LKQELLVSRTLGSYVLTRLHARYDRQTLAEDLIFRAAAPVVGGRASWDGKGDAVQAVVSQGGPNNFQGRYIVRHYWQKPVLCAKPTYGNWGGPAGGKPSLPRPAVDLANTAREQAPLGSLVRTALPELGIAGKLPPRAPAPRP